MPIVPNRNKPGRVVDRTDHLVQIPNNVGIINALNLFTDDYRSQKHIEITRSTRRASLLEDRNWGERNQTIAGREADSLLLKIPHFPADDAITPDDLDGIIQGSSLQEIAELETVASVRAEKMIALRETHDWTKEYARMQLITSGTAYAPRGTIVTNYYDEFGITREEIAINFAGAADPRTTIREARKASRAGLSGGQVGTVQAFVALCSESFYNALLENAYVTDALKYVDQGQALSILLGSGGQSVAGLDARFESVTMFGVTWINAEAAGYENDEGEFIHLVPEGDAYLFPKGVRDMFKTYYAPASRFTSINRKAQGSYWFEYLSEKDDIIEIMTEQNFLNACLAPGAIVRLVLDV